MSVQADNAVNGPITAPMMSEMLAANQPVMVDDTNIINVWRDNLEQAFKDIAEIVQTVEPPCRSVPCWSFARSLSLPMLRAGTVLQFCT